MLLVNRFCCHPECRNLLAAFALLGDPVQALLYLFANLNGPLPRFGKRDVFHGAKTEIPPSSLMLDSQQPTL